MKNICGTFNNLLFIAPVTNRHGQGIISSYVYEIVKTRKKIKFINTHLSDRRRINKFLTVYIFYFVHFYIYFCSHLAKKR